ncbi:MAG TPA: ribosome silencing factor [Usitatibacteraceae bacterium]|nr:ribosome silencing factor [Usitatibacteraceae bacterium]
MARKKLTTVIIDALDDIKARDIKLINVSKLTAMFEHIAVASADSTRQTRALARHVIEKVKEFGGTIYGQEGEDSGEWVLVDCGDVVVHIMQPAVRDHYRLEELWGEGKLEYPPKPRKAPAAAKPDTPVASRRGSAAASASAKKPPRKRVPAGSKTSTAATGKATVKRGTGKVAATRRRKDA